ncbi:MAG: serine protease Do [Oceanospirillaceae bacterium]|jgi:serine protease Do
MISKAMSEQYFNNMLKVALLLLLTVSLLGVSSLSYAQLPDFKSLVKESSPAVVNIATIKKKKKKSLNAFGFKGPKGEDIPDIFKPFLPSPNRPESPEGKDKPESLGSGFIISQDGYILTNHHVVKDAEKVIVRLNDRRELEATIIGSDKRSDIALLKIDATQLPIVKIGSSAKLEPGEWVLAIGSPFGFDHSVTAGIVSATGRALRSETYVPFIQTDVAINPGNSGGPLFNLDGEVVGINSQIYTRSGGFMGLSFAIPIDIAMNVVDQLRDKGFVSRGWLGVIIQEVSKDLAESFGLEKAEGALVVKVLSNSPAQKGGLQEGDIILKFEGEAINLSADLPHKVGVVPPGNEAEMLVVRGGETMVLSLVIGVLPSEKKAIADNTVPKSNAFVENPLNVLLADITQQQKEQYNLSSGVLVKQLKEGVGARAGLIPTDIITMLNGIKIQSVSHLLTVLKEVPKDKQLAMRIVRRGSPLFIPIKLNP